MLKLPKPRRIVDRKYREFVTTHRCTFPGSECIGPIDPAHITPRNGTKSMGSKVNDYRCIPLCRMHHERYGSGDTASESIRVVFESIIVRLNAEYQSLFPPKEKRERQASARVQHLLVMCACSKVHKLTPAKCGTIAEAEIRYWCPFKKAWQSASFRRTA